MAKANNGINKEEENGEVQLESVKTDPETADNNTGEIFWEWENDGKVWSRFSDEHMKAIRDGFDSGLQKMDMFINDLKFNIIFERMVQRNSKTYWERRIRATRDGDDDGGLTGTCCFQSDNGRWTSYDHTVQRLIHAATLYNRESVNYYQKGQRFSINLEKMEQLNLKNKKTCAIKYASDDDEVDKPIQVKSIGSRSVKKENFDEDVADESDIGRKQPKSKGTKRKEEPEEKEVVKQICIKGKAPVDDECFVKEKYFVYYEGDNIFDAMLNQTNLKNNNNKFYLMQILQTNAKNGFAVWFRWGRVGMTGQTNLISCGNDLDKAKELFCDKFFDKTKNEFSDRKKFKKVAGKYDLVVLDYTASTKTEEEAPALKKPKTVPPSTLDQKIQALVELLCNIKEMEDAVLEMKYDAKKAPLGKLDKQQIKNGYKALQKIEQCITNKKLGDELIKACDAFYTRIPHCYGMQRLPIIRTKQELKLKIELLETLGDIEIALKVIKEDTGISNPIDQHYLSLNCELKVLDHDSSEFKLVDRYTQNTHANTHNQYKMEVVDVFKIDNPVQSSQYTDLGNKMLLWHGSRLTNFVGILSQGLRIAPPEAPVTGYMFGKGVYFADISSKSANYCYPTRSKNTGFVLLCEVSLGKTNDLLAADYDADKLPKGCNSTKGLGKIAPSAEGYETLPDGVVVPSGIPSDTGVENSEGYTLNYNEYVVYDVKQVRSRFLVQLKFHFN